MKIQILPSLISDQIAAGEVVENPRSVVKELVENSIDAEAKNIEIWIENGGKNLIKIIDDGVGMSEENAEKCVLRHATSKIQNIDDLYSIQTFGFRGEALAAISAVSHFKLITKAQKADFGTQINISGGQSKKVSKIGANNGTQIIIKDLFFPTPARLKYLKKTETEYREIMKEVKSFALANPTVGFKCFKDGKSVFDTPPVQNSESRIKQVLSRISNDLLDIHFESSTLKISGFIIRPEKTIQNRTQQYFFVNHRKIEDFKLAFAVREAYNQSCGIEKHLHPMFVIFIEIDPILVDVNVHPRKLEVKFSEPQEIFQAIKSTCAHALEKISALPQNNFTPQQPHFSLPKPSQKATFSGNNFNQNLSNFASQSSFRTQHAQRPIISNSSFENLENPKESPLSQETELGELRLIGQSARKYILAENETGLFIFDQHALHERQRFEIFWKELFNKKIPTQKLLISQKINFEEEAISLFFENQKEIKKIGFTLNFLDDESFEILEIPNLLENEDLEKFFQSLIPYFQNEKIGENALEKLLRRLIEYKSCRGAIMYGDVLQTEEMQKILEDLKNTKFKWLCAHGRPNYIFYPFDDLDKEFHR